MIEPAVLLVLVLIIVIFSFILFQSKKNQVAVRKKREKATPPEQPKRKPCPLCGTMLVKGEKVKTVIYPAKGDTLAEVFGCPHCYGENADTVPICPVCKKPVPEEGHVIGRMFKEGRHLHVLGCTRCRARR